MSRFKVILNWMVVIIYLVVVFGFISEKNHARICHAIRVNILDSAQTGFIQQEDILKLLDKSRMEIKGRPISGINLKKMENLLDNQGTIKNAEVYCTNSGTLNIDIQQRQPLVRIIDKAGRSYYLDAQGTIIPLSGKYSPLVLIANGNITEPFDPNKTNNIWKVKTDNLTDRQKIIYDLFELVRYITSNEFWNAQIEQVYVNDDSEFEIIPRVGPHIIILGTIENYQEKFDKLMTFYKEGLNKVGWNAYLTINLKYKNQIVCTKN